MSLAKVNKAVAALMEDTAMSTVDELVKFLDDKIEIDADLKTTFADFKLQLKEKLTAEAAPSKKRKTKVAGGEKKAPTLFNLFVKKRMAELKEQDPTLTSSARMKQAAEDWNAQKTSDKTAASSTTTTKKK